ncbi:hypothetical protein D2E25_1641 [Bifidobacterium goeldii]|uniref:Uncharacterized protein n=1 Tax=Bifidobacterium goeldii TaxID=2306975 RepID=A0A430FHQ4_9BIFI|nr:hypothetical protein [Bifidobacterium goeldii]RSX52228.1 hypothetical protein D2E25_1641 [Bifidobacterium goeldii]
MDVGAWVDATESEGRAAWNDVKPYGGLATGICFVVCWAIVSVTLLLIPATHNWAAHPDEYKEIIVAAALTFVVARVLLRLQVVWHRHHMPAGMVGAAAAAFAAQGYEIVGGNDQYPSDDSDRRVALPVRAILFCPAMENRRIDVYTYPVGSTVGERGKAELTTLLISGTQVRIEGRSPGKGTNPRPKYRSNGQYLVFVTRS